MGRTPTTIVYHGIDRMTSDDIQAHPPSPFSYTMGGAIPICRLDKECGHVAGHDAGHRIVRVARPVLDLEAAALLLDELVLLGDERVVHSLERLADGGTDTTDIHEVRGGMNYLIKSGLVGIAAVALGEDASDGYVLNALHGVVLSFVPFRHL